MDDKEIERKFTNVMVVIVMVLSTIALADMLWFTIKHGGMFFAIWFTVLYCIVLSFAVRVYRSEGA